MCILFVAHRAVPGSRLVVAANRDELHARPTLPAARWAESPEVVAGRDLDLGGTWVGVTENGRFAAVTNVRQVPLSRGQKSRGELTARFLVSQQSAASYAASLRVHDASYGGYNLLVSDGETLAYASNRTGGARVLPPGIYGLSNDRLDTPWPKLTTGRARFAECVERGFDEQALFELLADRTMPSDDSLPDTGVGLDLERLLAPIFVLGPTYGTRSSTVIDVRESGEILLVERRFDASGALVGESRIAVD